MTVKMIQKIYCDRCKEEFTRRPDTYKGDFLTMEIGWFALNNGSGSKICKPDRSRDHLDYDICNDCTTGFLRWWKEGHPRDNK